MVNIGGMITINGGMVMNSFFDDSLKMVQFGARCSFMISGKTVFSTSEKEGIVIGDCEAKDVAMYLAKAFLDPDNYEMQINANSATFGDIIKISKSDNSKHVMEWLGKDEPSPQFLE